MRPPVRVAIFEPYVFDKVYGNLRYLLTLAERLDRSLVDPVLVVPGRTAFLERFEAAGGRWDVIAAHDRLRVHGGGILRAGFLERVGTSMHLFGYGRKLLAYLRAEGISVVQCHSIRSVMTIGLFARLAGRPVLWYVKGQLANPILDRIGFLLANRILFQGETNLRRRYPVMRKLFAHKLGILRNGIDLEEVEAARRSDRMATRRRLGLRDNDFVVGYVGQISPAKGMEELLEAARTVRAKNPSIRFLLVGDAGAEAYEGFAAGFRARAEKELSPEAAMFLGWRSDVLEIVAASDLVVLPSREEGMPKSIIEAMALERPVVVTRVGSVPDLIEHGVDGTLVPPNAPADLAREVLRLVENGETRTRYGEAARAKVLKRHSIVDNVRGLELELLRLARERPPEPQPQAGERGKVSA